MGRVRCVSLRTWCLCLCGLASLAWLQGVVHLHTGSLAREEGEARTQQNRSKEGEVVEDKVDMSRDIHLVERQVEEEPEGVPWIVNSTQARLWMDVPNALTHWRFCFQEYSNLLTLLLCDEGIANQIFVLEPVAGQEVQEGKGPGGQEGRAFQLLRPNGQCLSPQEVLREGSVIHTVSSSSECPGHWLWTPQGQLRWKGPVAWQKERVSCGSHEADSCAKCPTDSNSGKDIGSHFCHGQCRWEGGVTGRCVLKPDQPVIEGCPLCLTSVRINYPVTVARCRHLAEEQMVEVGHWTERSLVPRDLVEWRERQDRAREELLRTTRELVTEALDWIQEDELLHLLEDRGARLRRAVVLYMDQGDSGLQQLRWWIKAWRFVGLDQAKEAFDIVLMVHPGMVEKVSELCTRVPEDFSPRYNGTGRCLYKPYLGIAHRDPTYDQYMNSQECLVGPGTDFLQDYRTLLRADMDTFPTPRLLGFWPEGVMVDKLYTTNFGLASIKQAVKAVACEVGIEHHGWYNPGSTWFGDARRVRYMARLTTALSQFGRTSMFGPGTPCRCATCSSPPKECQWGGGPYPGVMLLYMQEIAVNHVLLPSEWASLPPGLFDQGTSSKTRSVCEPAVLHCYQIAELFSKLAFGSGKYVGFDMKGLDLTNTRDFATYMALESNGQGINGELSLEQFRKKTNNSSMAEWCSKHKPNPRKNLHSNPIVN